MCVDVQMSGEATLLSGCESDEIIAFVCVAVNGKGLVTLRSFIQALIRLRQALLRVCYGWMRRR